MKYFVFVFFFLIISCDKSESIPANAPSNGNNEYLPIANGKYISYKYDSTFFANNGIDKVKVSGFIREEIKELLDSNKTSKTYKIIKYWKRKVTDSWQISDVEKVIQEKERIIITDENLPFIRLVTPLVENNQWLGNSLFNNDLEIKIYGEPMKIYNNWNYKVIGVKKSIKIDQKTFENCTIISETDKTFALSKRVSISTYASGIGLIKREMQIYDTQRPVAGQAWETFTEKGFNLTMTYIDNN
jgi:hypothetical protein